MLGVYYSVPGGCCSFGGGVELVIMYGRKRVGKTFSFQGSFRGAVWCASQLIIVVATHILRVLSR